jgi:hypothetical protein
LACTPTPFRHERKRIMNARAMALAILGVVVCAVPAMAAGIYSDGFEGETLNPFWAPDPSIAHHKNSSYSLSTEQAFTGKQSLKLSFNATVFPDYPGFYMSHYFDAPVQGTFSVMFYDTMFPVLGGIYLGNQTFGNMTEWASMRASDGNLVGAYNYWVAGTSSR